MRSDGVGKHDGAYGKEAGMGKTVMPNDRDLAAMTPAQINELADRIAREGGEGQLERLSNALLQINGSLGKSAGVYTAKQITQRTMREVRLRRRMKALARHISPEMDRQYMLMNCWEVMVTHRRAAGVTDQDWKAVQAYRATGNYRACANELSIDLHVAHNRVHRAIDGLVEYFAVDEPMSAQIRWLLVEVFGVRIVRNYRDAA